MFTILHTESSTGWGGQENRTLNESLGLRKLGAKVLILCQPDSILGKKAEAEGFEVRRCRMKKSYDILAVRNIMNLIKQENVDIINTHSGRDTLLAGIAGRLSGRRPFIVRTRHLALPITSTFTYKFLAHRIVTVSEHVKKYLVSESIPEEKITAVPTGVDINRFNPEKARERLRQKLEISAGTTIIGTVSILRRKKGHHILLKAVPKILEAFPDTLFFFAGDGPQRDNIKSRIKKMGLEDKVFMLGIRNDIPDILKFIDIFVLPTLQEALGTSFIEAMALGKPVIGTDVGGVNEVIKDGVNGYLVKPEDPAELAAAVITMLKDRELAVKMGLEGRKMVEKDFTLERMNNRLFELYSSMLEERR
jgi:glycosyltransferase involved in cell wall biosynthesis